MAKAAKRRAFRRTIVPAAAACLLVLTASAGAQTSTPDAEAIGVSDVTETAPGQIVEIAEGIGVGDGTALVTGESVSVAEAVGVSDATATVTGESVELGEGIGVSDGTDVVTGQIVELEEGVGVGDGTEVEVQNLAPVVLLTPLSGDEGSPTTGSGSFSDPDSASWTATVNYGDGSGDQPLALEPDGTFGLSHVYDDDGPGAYVLTVSVTDNLGETGTATAPVTIANVAPTAVLADASGTEGATVTLTFSGQHDPSAADTAAGFTYRYACDGTTLGPETHSASVECAFDDDGAYPVLGRIADKDGDFTDHTAEVTVANVAPTGALGNDGPVDEGSPATVSWSGQSDPSAADTAAGFTYRYACDGVTLGPETTDPTATCTFDDGPTAHTVLARILDKDGGSTDRTTEVVVRNVAPAATLVSPAAPVDEGSSFTLGLDDVRDPSAADTAAGFTVEFDCGLGAGFGPGATCVARDDSSQIVRARIVDKDGGETILSALVVVANVAPAVTITGPPAGSLYQVGEPVTFTGVFTDAGVDDTHTAVWTLGTVGHPGTVAQGAGFGSTSLTTTFSEAGVYPVQLTVTDDDGGAGTATTVDGLPALVVVYDPSAGFVTGGGWIMSPAGAYAADPSATGKATFGFVAKYKPGAKVPDGNTEFRFQAGGFDLRATRYEWLVVAGSKAQYRGEATVNGVTGHTFQLTAQDGTPDRLRLKVWGPGGGVLYDNRRGESDDADPQAIGGGSIVVHRK